MPTASKILIAVVVLLSLGFIWLGASVLEARRNWDLELKKKAAEVAKVQKEIDVLTHGSEDLNKEFKELAKNVLQNGSAAANQEFDKKINEGFKPQAAFEVAMNLYIDKRILDAHQETLRRLNDVQKTAPPDEIARDEARKAFEAADSDLHTAQRNLDAAYRTYMGLEGQGGIRNLVSKGMGIEDLRGTLTHIRHITAAQRTVHNTIFSDGLKNLTKMKDLADQTVYERNTLRQAAESGMRELDELIKEHDLTQMELQRESAQLAIEIEKRDKAIAELDDLRQRFEEKSNSAKQLAQQVKITELRIDQKRGLNSAVISSDGRIPRGKIQKVDEQAGTMTINLGTRVGVRPGVQLEVFRFGDHARYLGKLEVTQSDSDAAVGRMLPEYRQVAVQAGDFVAPEITRELNP
jgi:hypothetical protein